MRGIDSLQAYQEQRIKVMNKNIYIIIAAILLLGGVYLLSSRINEPQTVVQSHRSYNLEIISDTGEIKPGEPYFLRYRIRNDLGKILKDFEIVHEKIMHLIIVRKDLEEFQHLHPEFSSKDGEFSINVILPADGPYRLFPDFTPGKDAQNPQLLPVTLFADLAVGNAKNFKGAPIAPDTARKTLGDYQITFSPLKEMRAQESVTYSLNIKKDGKEVTDLETYLGAFGHSVILRADTLDFIHTHAESHMMDMNAMDHENMEEAMRMMENSGPDISFETVFPQAGVYKVFTQFQHEVKVLTVDFVVEVKNGNAF